jgi:hypothetical protein
MCEVWGPWGLVRSFTINFRLNKFCMCFCEIPGDVNGINTLRSDKPNVFPNRCVSLVY